MTWNLNYTLRNITPDVSGGIKLSAVIMWPAADPPLCCLQELSGFSALSAWIPATATCYQWVSASHEQIPAGSKIRKQGSRAQRSFVQNPEQLLGSGGWKKPTSRLAGSFDFTFTHSAEPHPALQSFSNEEKFNLISCLLKLMMDPQSVSQT